MLVARRVWRVALVDRLWRFQQSTDDAYIASDISVIAPTIEGTIKEVRVHDNERVKEGQVLFLIDDADFVARLHQAEAVVASEEATVATYRQPRHASSRR